MRVFSFILFALVINQLSYSQTRLLNSSQFQNDLIDSDWVYVKLKPSVSTTPPSDFKILGTGRSKEQQIIKLRVPKGKDAVTFCNELRLSGNYHYADPIISYKLLANPLDPLLGNQYYLTNIKAFQAWDVTTGDDDITIGIIDSGMDLDHEDIATNLWINENDTIDGIDNDGNGYIDDYYGYDFADEDADPNIESGNHGMIVGGIAGARTNNNIGIAGVGYNTKVAALKGFRSSNNTSSGLYEAIIYAADNGIDVVNLSWGRMGEPLESEQDIINYAVLEKEVIVVAAAGNEGGKETEEEKWYPASYNNVLSVAATDASDSKWSGSTFNYSVDLAAPGVNMYSTVSNNGYADGGPGTSYAAPLVAAGAALVKDRFPQLSAVQIMERIRSTADDIYDIGINDSFEGKLGKGRLNILQAVSASSVKSIRSNVPSYSTSTGFIFYGDTIQIATQIINYLNASNNPQITISSPDNNFSIIDHPSPIGFLGTMDTASLSFTILLNETLSPDTEVNIRLDYSEGTYNDFQFLDLKTAPEYIDFGNDKISLTISGDGDLGYNSYGPTVEGTGFRYQLDTLMNYVGIMLATNSNQVSDNIISNYATKTRDQDFLVNTNFKLSYHPGADYFGYSAFNDNIHPLVIEQSSLSWDSTDYLITRYRIINHSDSVINNLSFGVFSDWNLDDASSNYAEYDTVQNYAYAVNANQNLYAGIKILGNGIAAYRALDLSDLNGNTADISNSFTDSLKYNYLVNQKILTAGSLGSGNDIATINGVTVDQLDASDFEYVDVIYAVSQSKEGLDSLFDDAIISLNKFLTKPKLLETFITCDGSSYEIDPSNGINYNFYSDPLGTSLITTDSILIVNNLQSDTTFFVRNMDGNYPSEIFEIRLNLFTDLADFELSTDTLYLDNPTTNVVSFTDLSRDAISWHWDFGQGTSSTIQNPSLSFSESGNYEIQLTIENEEGCIDSITKTLVVANRPPPPAIDDIVVCEGMSATLSDPSAEKIHVYLSSDQQTPTLSGTSVQIPNITSDSIFYISGIFNSFESDKTPVRINVLKVTGKIRVIPDTTTSDFLLHITAEDLEEGSSIQWEVNGSDAGTNNSISTPANGTITIDLTITSTVNCIKSITKQITVSSSTIPIHPDLISCNGDSVLIKPTNGSYFGFYEDESLTQFIKKGVQLKTNAFEKVYVVGLDDGLPSTPIEVNITNQTPEIKINYTTNPIGSKQAVGLTLETTYSISSTKWYVNGNLVETSAQPIIFLDNESYVIVASAITTEGCSAADTLDLDLTPPLSTADNQKLLIYPNPSNGIINIDLGESSKVIVYQMDGKEVARTTITNGRIDLSTLERGMYVLKIYSDGESIDRQILLR